MRYIDTVGFVLKKKSMRERDMLVTLFSKDHGKLALIAKGVCTNTSRRLSHLQTGNIIRAQIVERPTGMYLTQTQLISSVTTHKNDMVSIADLYTVLFTVDRLLPDGLCEPNVFHDIVGYIKKHMTAPVFVKTLQQRLGYGDVHIEDIMQERLPQFVYA